MATQRESGNRPARSTSKPANKGSADSKASGRKPRSASAAKATASNGRARAASGQRARAASGRGAAAPRSSRASSSASPSTNGGSNSDSRGAAVKGAIAVAGSAALGAAASVLVKRSRRPRVLGVQIPRKLDLRRVAPKKVVDPKKLASSIDLKHVIKQIGNAAEQIEARSDDVRILSGQAKRLSRQLS